MEDSRGYRKLVVWQEAKKLVVLVYRLTKNFPQDEKFGLTSQMRRAAVSVLSQIVEGWIRKSKKDKLHYLEIAQGSLLELDTQAEVSMEVGFLSAVVYEEFIEQYNKTAFLLYRYKRKIEE